VKEQIKWECTGLLAPDLEVSKIENSSTQHLCLVFHFAAAFSIKFQKARKDLM
jgi:hypothetical protein